MPVIGDPARFAVEYDLDKDHGGEWMFGRFCYWCDGRQVGDYDLGTSLRDVLFQLDLLVRNKHLRASRRFSAMPATAVFECLNRALFGVPDPDYERLAEEEQWARHTVFPPVDVFNLWKGFVVEEEQTARLIYAQDPYRQVWQLLLLPGEIDAVLEAARNALNNVYERQPSG